MNMTETINSPNCFERGGQDVRLIVMHIADGYYEGTKSWFLNPASQTSSHFVVARDGRVCQCVPLRLAAWCNGTDPSSPARSPQLSTAPLVRELGGNANKYSVSIEFEGFYKETGGALTAQQLAAAIGLVRHIAEQVSKFYGVTIPFDRQHIVGHYEIAPKTRPHCPGEKFPWSELIAGLNASVSDKTLYRVQVGAFQSRAGAERFRAETVLPKGIQAFVSPRGKDGLYRVQIGAFAVRANAEQYLREVKSKGLEAFLAVEEQ